MATTVAIRGKTADKTSELLKTEPAYVCTIVDDVQTWKSTTNVDEIANADQIVFKGVFETLADALRHFHGEDLSVPVTYLTTKYNQPIGYQYSSGEEITRKHEPQLLHWRDIRESPSQLADLARWIKDNAQGEDFTINGFGSVVGAFNPWEEGTEEARTAMWKEGICFNLEKNTVWLDEKRAIAAHKRYLTLKKKRLIPATEWKPNKKNKIRLTSGDIWTLANEMKRLLKKFIGHNTVVKPEWGSNKTCDDLRAIRCYAIIGNDLFGRGWYRGLNQYKLIKEQWANQTNAYHARFNDTDVQWLLADFKIRSCKINHEWAVGGKYTMDSSIFMHGVTQGSKT